MFKAYIGVLDEERKIRKVCEDIKKRDGTFRYKIKEPFGQLKQKFKLILLIFDADRDSLDKRAGWFIHKMKDAKVADYYWVKECNKKEEMVD